MKLNFNLKLNIAQKLYYGFGIILLFIIINGVLTFFTLNNSRRNNNLLTQEYTPFTNSLTQLSDLTIQSQMLVRSWVFIDKQVGTPDKKKLEKLHIETFPSIIKALKDQEISLEDQDTSSLNLIYSKTEKLISMQKEIMNSLNSFEAYEDAMITFMIEPQVQDGGELIILGDEIHVLIEQINSKYRIKSKNLLEDMSSGFTWFSILVVFMSLIITAIAIFVAVLLYNSIVSPLKKGVAFAQSIGKGDLTATVDVNQDDEIGQLADALKEMANNLKGIVISIKENSNKLVQSSGSLKENSMQLSKGSADQAASAEEVSTSIEEMAANIDQNTDNAIQTEKITIETAKDVNIANELSSEAAKAMREISDRITIIGDIAFQTNILALNAAVEAARAGDHGRGFSVVASEVRKLAERSKTAADEIASLVTTGLKVSTQAGEKARLLVPDIEKTTQLIKEITAASTEQKTGAEQINMAMQQLNMITQENASSSDMLTQSSNQLAELAQNLKEAVGIFKIDTAVTNEKQPQSKRIMDSKESTEKSIEIPKAKKESKNAPAAPSDFSSLGKEFDLDNYEKF